jgi:hypothetical protein
MIDQAELDALASHPLCPMCQGEVLELKDEQGVRYIAHAARRPKELLSKILHDVMAERDAWREQAERSALDAWQRGFEIGFRAGRYSCTVSQAIWNRIKGTAAPISRPPRARR